MRGISNNTGYSTPLSPLGTNLNAPQRQVSAAFDTPTATENPAPVLTARGAALTGSSTLGPETISTLLQAQEMGQEPSVFAIGNIMEDEVSRFLNARKKLGKILQAIEHPESEEKHAASGDKEEANPDEFQGPPMRPRG